MGDADDESWVSKLLRRALPRLIKAVELDDDRSADPVSLFQGGWFRVV
jgi:hypothetical protein